MGKVETKLHFIVKISSHSAEVSELVLPTSSIELNA
jgi:hypothetical protein